MNIPEIIAQLIAERERLNNQCVEIQCAIEALASLEVPKTAFPYPKAVVDGPSKLSTPCKYGCGKEFTKQSWRLKHEKDCAHVVPIPESEPTRRNGGKINA